METACNHILRWAKQLEGMQTLSFELSIPPRPFSYRAAFTYGPQRKQIPIVRPSEEYLRAKTDAQALLKPWLPQEIASKYPGMVVIGIAQNHVFPHVASTTKKKHVQIEALHGAAPAPTTVAKGDVHDNLNKLVPDALTEIGVFSSDAHIIFSMSTKSRDYNPRIEVTLFLAPKEIVDEQTI